LCEGAAQNRQLPLIEPVFGAKLSCDRKLGTEAGGQHGKHNSWHEESSDDTLDKLTGCAR
jgi:hypothetical protein